MKVLLINGSPHERGCTFTALSEVAGALAERDIETELFHIGTSPVRGCLGCGGCAKNGGKCVFSDDPANELIDRLTAADGVVIGSPVYYAGPNGALTALLDRVFYASSSRFAGKPGAAVASARRAGTTAALDRLCKYFTFSNMPIVPSQYWCMVHGQTPEEVRRDEEGLQIMRALGRNMAWLLESLRAGGVELPAREPKIKTSFIR